MKFSGTAALIFLLFIATDVAAQCANSADGDLDPNNPCALCVGTSYRFLPARTVCDADRRVQCDAAGTAWRMECVDAANDETVCEKVSDRFPDGCPGGLICDDAAAVCLRTCNGTIDCQANHECDGGVCRLIEPPCPGGKVRDTVGNEEGCFTPCNADGSCDDQNLRCERGLCVTDSSNADMGPGPSDMGSSSDTGGAVDLGSPPDLDGRTDSGIEKPASTSSCATAIGPKRSAAALLLALLFLFVRRRHV